MKSHITLLSMKRLASLLSFTVIFAFLFVATPAPKVEAAVSSLASIQSGDLIRGESRNAVYYYGADGFRYVFGNDKVYFTWYDNFDSVRWLSDADLGTIQIGGNVTYHPGTRMVKINSDPKTYAVGQGGTLRWVTSESVAIAMYGATWNKQIDDVPDSFFSNYAHGADITSTTDFIPATVKASVPSINVDKKLKAPAMMSIGASAYSPVLVTIQVGTAVRFTNTDTDKHTVTSDDLTWGSGTMEAGAVFTRRFNDVGVHTFFDSYRPQSTGTIIVQ